MSFDLNRGLEELAKYIAPGSKDWEAFEVHEGNLRQNLQSKNLFGETPANSAERAAILYQLNPLALTYTGVSFNDLAMGKAPKKPVPVYPPASSPDAPASLSQPAETTPSAATPSSPADSPRVDRPVVDLEILLTSYGKQRYQVDMRMMQPGSSAPYRPMQGPPVELSFDLTTLHDGKALSNALFADTDVKMGFDRARTIAQAKEGGLRVRLTISTSVNELHRIPWEQMNDPIETDKPLALSTLFSRYVSEENNVRPITPRPKHDMRALVVLSNPSDIADYEPNGQPLARIDVPKVEESMKTALAGFQVDVLASGGTATVDTLRQKLLHTGYDILLIVAHGAFGSGQNKDAPFIWLETETGNADVVEGDRLVQRLIGNVDRPPLLTVLASCQSAGDSGLAALGPQLARAGMPAVVAMQHDITVKTLDAFLEAFFRELKRDGRVDRAVNEARLAVEERNDWWVPVLFMRLQHGMIWQPGSVQGSGEQSIASSHQASPSAQSGTSSFPKGANVKWNTGQIRQLLNSFFDDDSLEPFCQDNFPEVYDKIASGLTRTKKIQLLLDYCVRRNKVHILLEQIKKTDPVLVDEYAPYHS